MKRAKGLSLQFPEFLELPESLTDQLKSVDMELTPENYDLMFSSWRASQSYLWNTTANRIMAMHRYASAGPAIAA